jgi:hypothetical protein
MCTAPCDAERRKPKLVLRFHFLGYSSRSVRSPNLVTSYLITESEVLRRPGAQGATA